jgi:hypothetical protein
LTVGWWKFGEPASGQREHRSRRVPGPVVCAGGYAVGAMRSQSQASESG